MIHEVTEENIVSIASVLRSRPKKLGDDVYRLELTSEENKQKLAIEIHIGLEVDKKRMNMVSVYWGSTFIQLHIGTAFIASELLRQFTFFGKQGGIHPASL